MQKTFGLVVVTLIAALAFSACSNPAGGDTTPPPPSLAAVRGDLTIGSTVITGIDLRTVDALAASLEWTDSYHYLDASAKDAIAGQIRFDVVERENTPIAYAAKPVTVTLVPPGGGSAINDADLAALEAFVLAAVQAATGSGGVTVTVGAGSVSTITGAYPAAPNIVNGILGAGFPLSTTAEPPARLPCRAFPGPPPDRSAFPPNWPPRLAAKAP